MPTEGTAADAYGLTVEWVVHEPADADARRRRVAERLLAAVARKETDREAA